MPREIARRCPTDVEGLGHLSGVGPGKLDLYAAAVLGLVVA